MSFVASTDEALTWLGTRRNDTRVRLQAMVDSVLEEQRKASGS